MRTKRNGKEDAKMVTESLITRVRTAYGAGVPVEDIRARFMGEGFSEYSVWLALQAVRILDKDRA